MLENRRIKRLEKLLADKDKEIQYLIQENDDLYKRLEVSDGTKGEIKDILRDVREKQMELDEQIVLMNRYNTEQKLLLEEMRNESRRANDEIDEIIDNAKRRIK